jgi:hypothetical protein
MLCGNQRLNEKAVDCVRGKFAHAKAGQIDLLVPDCQQAVVDFEPRSEIRRDECARALRTAD